MSTMFVRLTESVRGRPIYHDLLLSSSHAHSVFLEEWYRTLEFKIKFRQGSEDMCEEKAVFHF